jgi:mannitol/fructose-specific phosphotransferase system IIA component (Ntr-type)
MVKLMANRVLAREQMGSTGFGRGVAIPHGFPDKDFRGFHMGLFHCPAGPDFEALDERFVTPFRQARTAEDLKSVLLEYEKDLF